MAQEERYGNRDLTYSAWHRRMSTARFVGIEQAQLLAMIDMDVSLYVEYDDRTKVPLVLIETARDVGQAIKPATVTQKLAEKASLPAYCVLWKPDDKANPADSSWLDIVQFRIKRLWPRPERDWRTITPEEYAKGLLDARAWQANRIDRDLFGDGITF